MIVSLYLLKNSNSTTHFLTLVIASVLLASFGMYTQNVFGETIIDHISVSGSLYGSIGVNEDTNKIYVGYYHTNSISVIDGNMDKIANTIPVNSSIFSIDVNPTTNRIYATDFGSNTIYVIDGSTDSVIDTIQVPATAVAVNPNTNRIYAVSGTTISVVDGSTDNVVNVISTGNTPVPTSLISVAVNPNTNRIYASNNGGYENRGASTYVIDGNTNNVTATISGISASHLAVNPATNKIYVENYGSLIVIDGATNTWMSAPETASCVGVNPNTNRIYACDANENYQVNVINGTTNALISSLTGFTTATSMGVNPNINRIYVTDTYGNDVAVIGESVSVVPRPPTGLATTAVSSSQINLSWKSPANNGGSSVTGYMIERSIDNGTTWSTMSSNTGSITTTYSDVGLTHSTTYTYRVSTINDVGTSTPSNTVSATTFNVVPTPPTGLTATGKLLQINLSWTVPNDDGGATITGYEIERSTNGGSTWSILISNTGTASTAYSDPNVLPIVTYAYRVSAINDVGTSDPSNSASALALKVGLLNPPALS